jgi:hypothetical protein
VRKRLSVLFRGFGYAGGICTSTYTTSTTAFSSTAFTGADGQRTISYDTATVGAGQLWVDAIQVAWRPSDLSRFPEVARPTFNLANPSESEASLSLYQSSSASSPASSSASSSASSPSSPSSNSSSSASASGGLSPGAAAGIGVGSAISFCLLLLGIALVLYRRHRRRGGSTVETGGHGIHTGYGKPELDAKTNMRAGNTPAIGVSPAEMPAERDIEEVGLPTIRRKPIVIELPTGSTTAKVAAVIEQSPGNNRYDQCSQQAGF